MTWKELAKMIDEMTEKDIVTDVSVYSFPYHEVWRIDDLVYSVSDCGLDGILDNQPVLCFG